MAQRGYIIFPAHLFRQLHEADEHGGNHEDSVDALLFDQPQKFLGVEARHNDKRAAEPASAKAERIRSGMIERSWQQRP